MHSNAFRPSLTSTSGTTPASDTAGQSSPRIIKEQRQRSTLCTRRLRGPCRSVRPINPLDLDRSQKVPEQREELHTIRLKQLVGLLVAFPNGSEVRCDDGRPAPLQAIAKRPLDQLFTERVRSF